MQNEMSCYVFRGGTSKALFLEESLLPLPGRERDSLLIKLIGGPDPKQIDGIGGGVTQTSKAALIKKSSRPDIDVDYTFAQIVVGADKVDYQANCGNISSAVGPYAIEAGLVEAREGETTVRIFNVNTGRVIHSTVSTPLRKVSYEGDFAISGVAGTGSEIELRFLDPQGAATGRLLPTGNAVDMLNVPGFGTVEVSVVDASNLFVFVDSGQFGINGCELPEELDAKPGLYDLLESVRGLVAEKLGYVKDWKNALVESPAVPKLIAVSKPQAYTTSDGSAIAAEDADIQARMMTMKKTHKTIALTGALCIGAAAIVEGSVVNRIVAGFDGDMLRIANPGGIISVNLISEPILMEAYRYGASRPSELLARS